ncbi:hypothetical protein OH687_35355 [Burkholderia anthina]|nr:hypothetical protein OH687_35355 [Burkholderia anthina]
MANATIRKPKRAGREKPRFLPNWTNGAVNAIGTHSLMLANQTVSCITTAVAADEA